LQFGGTALHLSIQTLPARPPPPSEPAMTNVDLSPREALEQFFGFTKFKGDQEPIVQSVLDGRDTFVIMPTGGGKSLCYQLPALMSEGTAIVVSPLIALMKNQVDLLRGFGGENGVAHFLNSSLSRSEAQQVRGHPLGHHQAALRGPGIPHQERERGFPLGHPHQLLRHR
jgi:superfamily II DNA helicase RecQ